MALIGIILSFDYFNFDFYFAQAAGGNEVGDIYLYYIALRGVVSRWSAATVHGGETICSGEVMGFA